MSAALPTTPVPPPTFARRLGTTTHCSLLLHRLRAAGLETPAQLAAAALNRGLYYYAPADPKETAPVLRQPVENMELAIALLHPSLPWDPQRIRLAAALLATRGLLPEKVAHLAVQERAAAIVRHIAAAAATVEPEEDFWRELLRLLPVQKALPPGLMPHYSRFMAISGKARPGTKPQAVWIRPAAEAQAT